MSNASDGERTSVTVGSDRLFGRFRFEPAAMNC